MARLHAAAQTVLEIIQRAANEGRDIRQDVRSRAIEFIHYDPSTAMMSIRFVGKDRFPTYEYPGVPADEVAKWIASRSKGRHYHRWIKDQWGQGG